MEIRQVDVWISIRNAPKIQMVCNEVEKGRIIFLFDKYAEDFRLGVSSGGKAGWFYKPELKLNTHRVAEKCR